MRRCAPEHGPHDVCSAEQHLQFLNAPIVCVGCLQTHYEILESKLYELCAPCEQECRTHIHKELRKVGALGDVCIPEPWREREWYFANKEAINPSEGELQELHTLKTISSTTTRVVRYNDVYIDVRVGSMSVSECRMVMTTTILRCVSALSPSDDVAMWRLNRRLCL